MKNGYSEIVGRYAVVMLTNGGLIKFVDYDTMFEFEVLVEVENVPKIRKLANKGLGSLYIKRDRNSCCTFYDVSLTDPMNKVKYIKM